MLKFANPLRVSIEADARIAERLRAHARLCRQIALESWNEETASELRRLADQCTAAASDIERAASPPGIPSRAC